MFTLHDLVENMKNIGKWAAIGIGSIIVLVMLFNIGKALKNLIFPPPLPKPTIKFGKLPHVPFPDKVVNENFTYSLNTCTGTVPVLKEYMMKVYKITKKDPQVTDLDNAKEMVAKIDFTDEQGTPYPEKRLTPVFYQWTDQSSLSRKIVMNVVTSNFNLTSNYLNNVDVLNKEYLPDEADATDTAIEFLKEMFTLLPSDVDDGKTATAFTPDDCAPAINTQPKATLLAIKDFAVVATTSLSNAHVIRIDFFQKPKDTYPIFYPNPPFSTMTVFVASGHQQAEIVQANYFHQTISDTASTYPIKTAAQAFEELKQGKGYIASFYSTTNKVKIKKIYLAYFLSSEEQEYLMPIFVFEGNDGFFAYVSAVDNSLIEPDKTPTPTTQAPASGLRVPKD